MTGGRPLRFLALALGGWVVIRIAVLLPQIGSMPATDVIPRLIAALLPDGSAPAFARRHAPASPSPSPSPAPYPTDLGVALPFARPKPHLARAIEVRPESMVVILAPRVALDSRIDRQLVNSVLHHEGADRVRRDQVTGLYRLKGR